jgi:phage terminase large subunit-like protein
MHAIDAYARDVVSGKVLAGKYHRLACARHQRDRDREGTRSFPYLFEVERAERFFRFAQRLKHYKGEWAGRCIELQPHQLFRLGSVFAWTHRDTGLRRFRVAYNELPRKNGKSLESALVALYLGFFDGEAGSETYCVATKREQARIVFRDCQQLVQSSGLRSRIRVLVANLHRDDTASKLEPLGADKDSTDGLNPHVVIVDEAHAMKDRGMIDVMETATGARRQPLIFWITTAGSDLVSPCGDQHHYACQVLDQVITDEQCFAFIAHADPEDDWTAERTWRKANPNYGVSVKPDDLRALIAKAVHMPAAAAAVQQKRLNLWVNAIAPWLSLEGWRAGQSEWTPVSMTGEPCWVGVDLSSKIDLTAVVILFPPGADRKTWRLICHALTPADTLHERARRDRAPYPVWVDRGWLQTNPGNRIDQDRVRDLVVAAAAQYQVQGVGIDPWNAGNLVTDLEAAGLLVVEVPQNRAQLSETAKQFEADVLDGLVDGGGNELLTWAVSNVVAPADDHGNIYPSKKRSRGRIDPVMAALNARKLATVGAPAPPAYQFMVLG